MKGLTPGESVPMTATPTVRTIVSFRSELERVENPPGEPLPAMPDPPGSKIARHLVDRLRSRGFVVPDERPFEDYCRMIDCASGDRGFEIRVGFVGDDPQQWLVTIDSTLSFIGRLMGKRDTEASRQIAEAVDDALRAESAGCSEIRWYTPRAWDGGGEDWADHPVPSPVLRGGTET